jgi:hypothetical protein
LRYTIPPTLWSDLRDAELLHPLAPTPADAVAPRPV